MTLPCSLLTSPPGDTERPLLSKSTPQSLEYQVRCTSHRASYSIEDGAVLEFADEPKFWIPSPFDQDARPCLEIAFRHNHMITAVEIRGRKIRGRFKINVASSLAEDRWHQAGGSTLAL